MLRLTSLVFAFVLASTMGMAQDAEGLWKKGLAHKEKRDHDKCVEIFSQLVNMDGDNAEYLAQLSQAQSRKGALMSEGSEQKELYTTAKDNAKKAISIDDNSAEAHLAMAVALARENENASTKTKISNAKQIKKECDRTLELDPNSATAYHIMGRWHRTFASLNGFERTMINTFYGGTPEGGTFKDALENLAKAIKLEPELSMHVYQLAETYYEMDDEERAEKYAKKALEYPQNNEDAKKTYKEAKALLSKLD